MTEQNKQSDTPAPSQHVSAAACAAKLERLTSNTGRDHRTGQEFVHAGSSQETVDAMREALALLRSPAPQDHFRGGDLTYKVHPNIVFNAACGIDPYIFSTIPSEAHRAASPMTVQAAREKALAVAARAIDAAMEAAWLPIEQADRSITNVQSFEEVGITLRNSARYWVRDEEGRTFEASWTEGANGRNYWWDWEAESPVDPVEFMPHLLATTEGSTQ